MDLFSTSHGIGIASEARGQLPHAAHYSAAMCESQLLNQAAVMIYLHWTAALTLFLEQFHVTHSLETKGRHYYYRKFQPRWLMFAKVLTQNRKIWS